VGGDQLTLSAELVRRIITVLESAAEAADTAMDFDDEYDGMFVELRTETREARDDLKVAAGIAKKFDDHFTKVEDSTGEDVEVGFDEAVDDDKLHHIWTVLDAEGELAIMPGRHYVNRLSYVVTTEPWTDSDLETEWVY
jgi:hypothetical protein